MKLVSARNALTGIPSRNYGKQASNVVSFDKGLYNTPHVEQYNTGIKPMRVALYARVSTRGQSDRNLSIPDQVRQLTDYCGAKHTIIRTYEEHGVSARSTRRPEFQAMCEDIENGEIEIDAILTLTTSRLFRNTQDAINYRVFFRTYGIRLVAIHQDLGPDDNPAVELVETIFAAFDQMESRNISFHTSRTMKQNARNGNWNGSKPPFGYRVEKVSDGKSEKGKLRIDADEAPIVKEIYRLYLTGEYGAVEIAKRLNRHGVLRRGKQWTKIEVLKLLHNRAYTGTYEYGKVNNQTGQQRPREEWIEMAIDPIITSEEYEESGKIMDTKSPTQNEERIHRGPMLFTGLLKCGHCGSQMVSAATKKGSGKIYRYYCCKKFLTSGKDACPGCRVRVDLFEQVVLETVLNWIFSSDNVLPVVRALSKALKNRSKPLNALRHRIEEVQAALTRYQEGFEQGAFTVNDVAERFRELAAKKRELEEEYAQRSAVKAFPKELAETENLVRIQEQLKEVFRTASAHVKKQYLHVLIERMVFDGKQVQVKARNDGIIAVLENLEALEAGEVTKVISQVKKWQPDGDSNPGDGTENPTS